MTAESASSPIITQGGSDCCARPPFALERLDVRNEDQVIYRLPKAQRDGARALTLTPLGLIDYPAALIPRQGCTVIASMVRSRPAHPCLRLH